MHHSVPIILIALEQQLPREASLILHFIRRGRKVLLLTPNNRVDGNNVIGTDNGTSKTSISRLAYYGAPASADEIRQSTQR